MNQSLNQPHPKRSNSVFYSLLFGLLSVLGIVNPLEAAIIPTGNVEPAGTWTSSIIGYVGITSNGSLLIDAGSVLQSNRAYIAYNSGVSGTATITGTGSIWANLFDLYVGNSGTGTLRVESGGQVSNSTGHLGSGPGSSGTATITGPGSIWSNSNVLYIGQIGAGTLHVESGGQVVTNGYACLGDGSGSSGTATITGAGSKWTNNRSLSIGQNGAGTLHVESGGQVTSSSGYLGANSGSSGTVTITGAGSKWTNSSDLYVGRNGSGTLTVADGGEVTAQTLYASLGNLLGNGTITATIGAVLDADLRFDAAHPSQISLAFGSGGTLTVTAAGGALGAGYKGNGSLTIADGVTITSSTGYLGYIFGSSGTGTITGAGSKWTDSDSLNVGYLGTGSLFVEAGGQVSNSDGYLGYNSGSSGTATVTGAGSKWTNSGSLDVGNKGIGTLRIEAGGQVTSSFGSLGDGSGSSGTATITGAGSMWTNSGVLYVGQDGTGTLTVTDGGEVAAGTLFASLENLFGNGTITAKGAVLDADLRFDTAHQTQNAFAFGSGGTLTVALSGGSLGAGYKASGSLTVAQGVTVNSSSGYLGYNSGSSGAATITGTGSKWTNSSDLHVGYFGTGTLRIEAGGQVNNTTGYLGNKPYSVGAATITGAGSKWTNSGNLYVGYSGAGTLRIEAGGQVSDTIGYLGYYSTCTATITGADSKWINSGDLYVGYRGSGTLRIEAGGQVSDSNGVLGSESGSSGTAIVTGSGSMWTNSGILYIGDSGTGTLHIRDGGTTTASSVSVKINSLLTLDMAYGSTLRVGSNGTGTITNKGRIRLLTGPQPTAGSQYSPITAGTGAGAGTYQALGGTWNATSRAFTVSQTLTGTSGTPVAVDLTQEQRVLVTESAKNWTVGASLLAKTGTGNTFNFTATAVSGTDLTALNALLEPGQSLLSGWNLTAAGTGYSASDPIYLSLGIPSSLSHGNLQLWRQTSSTWNRFTADDLTPVDGYASFTITGLSTYAVAAFPPQPTWKADTDGLWQNGSNWTTNPTAPGGVNTVAVLGPSITASRTVTLAAPLTLGLLTFDSAQHYTLSGTDSLKLEVNPTYTAEINVPNSDAHGHVIETPLTLASPLQITLAPSSTLTLAGPIQNPTGQTLTLTGGGTLIVTQGLATTGKINVQSGTLITPSLTASTLTIGTGSTPPLTAVPEPSTLLLILLAASLAIPARFLLARRYSYANKKPPADYPFIPRLGVPFL